MPKCDDNPTWMEAPEDNNFPAASDYLALVAPLELNAHLIREFRKQEIQHFKAKDILRASGLDILPRTNLHVT